MAILLSKLFRLLVVMACLLVLTAAPLLAQENKPSPQVAALLKQATSEPVEKSLETLQKALIVAEKKKDEAGKAEAYYRIGNIYSNASDYPRADKYYQKALDASRISKYHYVEARTVCNIANNYLRQGKLERAEAKFREAYQIVQKFREDKVVEAFILENLTQVYHLTDRSEQVLKYGPLALERQKARGNKQGQASILVYLGDAYLKTNEPVALEKHQQALRLFRELGYEYGQWSELLNIGNLQSGLGRLPESLSAFQEGASVAEHATEPRMKEVAYRAEMYINIGYTYLALGQHEMSLGYTLNAQKLLAGTAEPQDEFAIQTNLGVAYMNLNRLAESFGAQEKALELCRRAGNEKQLAAVRSNLGILYYLMDQPDKALSLLQLALLTHRKTEDSLYEANALTHIGAVYAYQGKFTQAANSFDEALALQEKISDTSGAANTLHNRGLAALEQADEEKAKVYFQQAIEKIESQRATLRQTTTDTRTAFQESQISVYLEYIDVLLKEHKTEEAYLVLQKVRARTLREQFQREQLPITGQLTAQERRQEQELRQRCNALNAKLLTSSDAQQAGKVRAELIAAEANLSSYQETLLTKYPDLAVRRALKTATLEDIVRPLPNDTVLLEFLTLDLSEIRPKRPNATNKTVVFVLTKDELDKPVLNSYSVNLPYKFLMERANDFQAACRIPGKEYQAKASEWYHLLLEPAEETLKGKSRVVICPDGVLWRVPFAVMMDGDGKHLLEKMEVAIEFSGTGMQAALEKTEARKEAQDKIVVIADPAFGKRVRFTTKKAKDNKGRPITIPDRPITIPDRTKSGTLAKQEILARLPGTKAEATAIKQYFPDRAEVFTGKQAQESEIKKRASQSRYLHLATHGFFNDTSPFQSFIALAEPPAGSEEDGLLTAREVVDLDLFSCKMVVLSACETGVGEAKYSEGIVGMTWALFAAGCPTQVVSSWKVSDAATATLMSRFYHSLSEGKAKGTALREASLSLMADKKYQHPYYWSPFVLMGDWQ